jgi:hypothetical protein
LAEGPRPFDGERLRVLADRLLGPARSTAPTVPTLRPVP